MISYNDALGFLYTQLPMYQRIGASAYKPGLDTVLMLDDAFENPHTHFKTIHVAGTNGKGSTAHTLAAILQCAGYRVGLFTSPHLIDFRERIRVNGKMISQEYVCSFVERYQSMNINCDPSFFELTMTMAFDYFAHEHVDIAVIEVGLGGRLDSTNIITPLLCIITNISFDHMAFLGNTLTDIAAEKAGIMKPHTPIVIGEAEGEVKSVFIEKAAETNARIVFAEDETHFEDGKPTEGGLLYKNTHYGDIVGELSGDCQPKNTATILTALEQLQTLGMNITSDAVKQGFSSVCKLTGLAGRWMTIAYSPTVICDIGHNEGGWRYLSRRLSRIATGLHMVIGFVKDKDVAQILETMPRNATYYFTNASIPRALPAAKLAAIATTKGLKGTTYNSVEEAYHAALEASSYSDTVFVGGSSFVVADLLSCLGKSSSL